MEPDLLVAGDERPPRRPAVRRAAWLAVGAVGLAVVGGPAVLRARSDAREAARTERRADVVHVRGRLVGVSAPGPDGLVVADVSLTGAPVAGERVVGVRLEGEGLTPGPAVAVPGELPQQVLPQADVDCARVASQGLPAPTRVVVTVVAASGRAHDQRLDVDPAALHEAARASCGVPDPDAQPVLEASARDGHLLLFASAVPRDRRGLVVQDVRVPGFRVRPLGTATLPLRLPPDTGALVELAIELQDCAAAGGPGRPVAGAGGAGGAAGGGGAGVGVVLRQDGRDVERAAELSDLTQPQPGAEPVPALLARLAEGCP